MAPAKNNDSEIHRLRELILQEDPQKLEDVHRQLIDLLSRLENPEEWLAKLDPVIIDALAQKSLAANDEMAEALAPVMGPAIQHQIAGAKDDIVDVLYPVIGKTIRKSIAEAMKNLVQTINERLDRALSFRNILTRMRAKASGISEAELVIKESLPFQIQEIFYIHKETGLLLCHVSTAGKQQGVKEEIISGMLTAIRDFAATAFAQNGGGEALSEIRYENLQIYLVDGRRAYLAVVASGYAPEYLSSKLTKMEEKIHRRFAPQLRAYQGNADNLTGINAILASSLADLTGRKMAAGNRAEQQKSSPKGLVYLAGIAILVVAGFAAFRWVPDYLASREIRAQIEQLKLQQPLFGSNTVIEVNDRNIVLSGFFSNEADTTSITALLRSQTSAERVVNHLEPGLQRDQLRKYLDEIARSLPPALADRIYDFRYVLDGNVITISGQIDNEEQRLLMGHALAGIEGIKVIINDLSPASDGEQLAKATKAIEGLRILFPYNESEISPDNEAELRQIGRLIVRHKIPAIYINAYSDDLGTPDANMGIAKIRAERVRQVLMEAGVQAQQLKVTAWGEQYPIASNASEAGRAQNRRVELTLRPKR